MSNKIIKKLMHDKNDSVYSLISIILSKSIVFIRFISFITTFIDNAIR